MANTISLSLAKRDLVNVAHSVVVIAAHGVLVYFMLKKPFYGHNGFTSIMVQTGIKLRPTGRYRSSW